MKGRLIGLSMLLVWGSTAAANVLDVPGTFPTIQAAVDVAQPGDTVRVAAGTYHDVTHVPAGPDTTRCAVVMKSDITLLGDGPGLTIIDCQLQGRGIHCGGVTGSTIEGFTITQAFAQIYGAAIYCTDGSSPTIRNCEVTLNEDGGIICLHNSSPAITDCVITDNVAKQGGGMELEDNCAPIVTDCVVTGNSSPSGGGIFVRLGSAPEFVECRIADNFIDAAFGAGGGAIIINASATFTDCRIETNLSGGGGGGIAALDNSVVTMTDCVVQGNTTTGSFGPGGGLYADFSSYALDGCTITENEVQGDASEGGGIYAIFAGSFTMTQCTVAYNRIEGSFADGGGITASFCTPVIEKSIIAFNDELGLSCVDNGNPTVSCTDVYGNGDDTICGVDGGSNFSLDPEFCDAAASDYRIQETSPCAPGNHPGGASTCDGERIGAGVADCSPLAIPGTQVSSEFLRLLGSRPNPFGSTTAIHFELGAPEVVRLEIFDVRGRRVRQLVEQLFTRGAHQVIWDARDETGALLPDGVYFYQVRSRTTRVAGRMVLAR